VLKHSLRAEPSFANVLSFAVSIACLALSPTASAAVNGNIIFNRGGQLYKADPVSGAATLFGNGSQPNYSLDGTTLVYVDSGRLFLAGSGLTLPGGGPANGAYPKVSPDNTHVAYQKTTTVGSSTLYHTYIIGAGVETELNPGGTNAYIHPAWFPDTAVSTKWKVLFVRTAANQAAVDAGTYAGDMFAEDFTFASNGAVIEGNKTALTHSPAKYSFPAYSPNGQYVIFCKDDGLWLMSADGTAVGQIKHDNGGTIGLLSGTRPAWSPDGKKVAFDFFGVLYTADVAIAADGSATASNVRTLLTTSSLSDMYPSWQAAQGGAPPPPAVDLDVRVTDTPDPVIADSTLTYTVSVMNKGLLAAPNVQANTAIPNDALFIASGTSQGCARVGTTRNVTCAFGNIVSGDTISKQITVRPTGRSSPLTFNVSVTSDLPDADPSNNSSIATTTVGPNTPPPNDNFLPDPNKPGTGPIKLDGMSGTKSGTNVGATREIPMSYGFFLQEEAYELNHAGQNGGKSVWYYWTPPADATGAIILDTRGSNFDTLLAAYSLDMTNYQLLKEFTSNDDAPGTVTSAVTFNFDSKHLYYFVVDGKQGATGQLVLNWTAVSWAPPSGTAQQRIDVGIFPAITCTSTSNAPDICSKDRDTSGNFLLHIKGRNFTRASRVLLKGYDILGLPQGQIDYLGQVGDSYSELVVHVPPDPPLGEITRESVRVVTPVSSAPGSSTPAQTVGRTSNTPDGSSVVITPLPDNTYNIAYGSRALDTFEVQFIEILPGEKKTICLNLSKSGDVCILIENRDTKPIRLTPTYFGVIAECDGYKGRGDRYSDCMRRLNSSNGTGAFALNPGSAFIGSWTIRQKVDLTAPVVDAIRSAGGKIALAMQGGKAIAGVVSNDSASLVATGGGNLVATGGGNLIAAGAGNVVSNDSASLITNDGGTLITNDGGTLITNDGGTLIGNDGGTFTIRNGVPGFVTGGGDLTTAAPTNFVSRTDTDSVPTSRLRHTAVSSTSTSSSGVSGPILATSSGGQEPAFTTETDPVTGEVTGYLTVTLDDTSFPRASELKGMAFTVLVNPQVAQFAANTVTVAKGAGRATVTFARTGDKSGAMTIDYETEPGTANDRSDYSPLFGSVTFAPGETTKDVTIPLINHGYGTSAFGVQRSLNLVILDVVGGAIQTPNYATITITNDQAATSATNPLDSADAQFFVRQQYLDLLGREPSASELASASLQISQCGSNQPCVSANRMDLSYSLFVRYEQAASFVFRLYREAYGNNQPFPGLDNSNPEAKTLPGYAKFLPDVLRLLAASNTAGAESDLARDFGLRPELSSRYADSFSGPAFVDAMLATIKDDSGADVTSQRDALISLFNQTGTGLSGRAAVLYWLAYDNAQTTPINNRAFVDAARNPAFAATVSYAYLRRDADALYVSRLQALNQNGDYRKLVDALDSSTEYRTRFGSSSCAFSLASTSTSVPATGGTGNVTFTATASDCAWTAASNASFVSISSATSGTGNGGVTFSVTANPSSAARSGTLTIGGQTFTVNQSRLGCSFTLASSSASVSASSGTGGVSFTGAASDCAWTATSNVDWITITSGSSGSGNGTVAYAVAANSGISSRTGTIAIADQTFTVTQAGAAAGPTVAFLPSSARAPGAGGAFYTTDLTVANTGTTPTTIAVKFLGNNADGRGGPEKSFAIGAGASTTFSDVLGSVFGLTTDYGAIRITSPSDSVRAAAQTSTPGFGGTFGQNVPAAMPADLITGGTPRSILAVREDASFRTNLILANATEAALDVDVQLISADGAVLASKPYPLASLGMTQVTRVVRDMGIAANLSGARLVISTPTTSGAFAAYASAVDNVTNDPRTLLPR
jgi:uncharacterized repeat protein (TIGR01451 family)